METRIELPAIELGGARYAVADEPTSARLEISRTTSGWAIRLQFDVAISGPCTRCLEDAVLQLAIDAREVDERGTVDEELRSPYVEDDVLDLDAWARDALALATPAKYLCRADCAGLCPVCGESLNDADADAHRHEPNLDPRWERLRELTQD
jgi:uncharacterized protein